MTLFCFTFSHVHEAANLVPRGPDYRSWRCFGSTACGRMAYGADTLIVRPDKGGVGGLLFWPDPAPVELPLGAALCGLLPVLGKAMRPPAEIDPRPKYQWVVEFLPFQGHRRDGDRFQLPSMEQLQAQAAVTHDLQAWRCIFAAMAEGVDLAADIADADKMHYKREIDI